MGVSYMKCGALDIDHLKTSTQHRLVDWLKIMLTASKVYVAMYM